MGSKVTRQIGHSTCETLWVPYRLVFVQSRPNFINKLLMAGGILFVFGQRSRSTLALFLWNLLGNIYRIILTPTLSNFTLYLTICSWLMEEPSWFWVNGFKGQGQFGPLPVKPCGHDTVPKLHTCMLECEVLFKGHWGWWPQPLFWKQSF